MAFRRGAMSSAVAATEFPATTPLPWLRALQTSEPQTNFASSPTSSHNSTTTTSSGTVATTSRPFFTDPSSVTPPPSASSTQSQAISKIVLQYVLIAAFAVIFGGLLIQRIIFGRRHNTSLWSSRQSTSSPDVPAIPRRFPRTTGLTEVPPYPYSRRTRALDTDAAGRRVLGTIDTSDHDGYIGDKDVLPAYDNSGGPPQYREVALELNVLSTTRNVDAASENSTGNAGDSHPPARDPGDASGTRDIHSLSGSGSADVVREPESLTVPPAVHVRQ